MKLLGLRVWFVPAPQGTYGGSRTPHTGPRLLGQGESPPPCWPHIAETEALVTLRWPLCGSWAGAWPALQGGRLCLLTAGLPVTPLPSPFL